MTDKTYLTYQTYLLIFVLLVLVTPAFAQSLDVSVVYPIADDKATGGDVLMVTDKGVVRADSPASNQIFGVIVQEPMLSLSSSEATGSAVARSGQALVNVTDLGGTIKNGDYITSSEIPGKGKKANISGYVLGVAMADFEGPPASLPAGTAGEAGKAGDKVTYQGKEYTVGQIPVAIRVENARIGGGQESFVGSLDKTLGGVAAIFLRSVDNPDRFFQMTRYFMAGAISLVAFIFGFSTFSRATIKGVEAVGRNPLAKNAIYTSIIFNVILTVITILAGIAASLFILRL